MDVSDPVLSDWSARPAASPSELVLDALHLRIFAAGWRSFGVGEWGARDVQSSFWRFYCNDQDGFSVEVDGVLQTLQARRIYFIPAGVRFSCFNPGPTGHFYLHFDVIGWPEPSRRELFNRVVELDDSALAAQALALVPRIENAATDLACHCRLKALLYGSLGAFLEQVPMDSLDRLRRLALAQEVVRPALDYIEDNLATRLTVAELARRCHLSEDYFARRFRDCTGQPPLAYILDRRIALAAQRLLFSSASIDEIAASTGFGNRFYFSRQFARRVGTSPALYRKATRV